MKKYLLLILFSPMLLLAQVQTVTYSFSPTTFEETSSVTVTVNGSSVDESAWSITDHSLYMWAWSYDLNDANSLDCPTNGTWASSDEANKFTYNSGSDTYTMTFVPQTFFNRTGIGRFGFLIKAKDGTGDKKSQDIYTEVGAFSVTMVLPPSTSPVGAVASGGSFTIMANNTNGTATYVLSSNGSVVNTNTGTSYTYNHTGLSQNQYYSLAVTQGSSTITKQFACLINASSNTATMPSGLLDGINYDTADPTKATVVLTAPLKDFVYLAGSFNNWQPTVAYAMKKDPTTGKFWYELTGLTSGAVYTYQYWVYDTSPLVNSPKLVKTADPCSTLVLSYYDDPYIPASSYPNMPSYPNTGNTFEVTVLQTNQAAYNWQVTNFTKPSKEDLVVYEVLVRDFDEHRTYQDLIDKIDYFKNLNINAIELMPVMEFEGDESWGYNTVYHMALDKFYGPKDKLKEFVDVCHQNGIAVILDIAFNHAFGRNPMVRMWMLDTDNDGWDNGVSSENPYFNQTAKHTYGVGLDFNHSVTYTKNYVKRVVKYWIDEFKIDGFRWDLTKGFTQSCTDSNSSCTDGYLQDRVDILKEYADFSWSVDPNHYVIFEHLGSDLEEKEWANYRLDEGKGVMMWGKITDAYNQLTMGYGSSSDFSRVGHLAHAGFNGKRVMGYAESHDEERLMYKNVTYGNSTNSSHDVKNLNVALSRMSALGAVSFMVPGPKMIWHFGDLGMDNSIYTCTDGSYNTDCKLATKPQPQWTEDWLNVTERKNIYDDWGRMIALKINEPVFEGSYAINTSTLQPRIYVWNDALASTELKNVVVLANFDVYAQNIIPSFPYTGTWYNLMDNSSVTVSDINTPINIEAGGFRIYGNKPTTLALEDSAVSESMNIYPNPTNGVFNLNLDVEKVQIFDVSGKLVKEFSGNQNRSYNVSELKSAIYFVRIQTQNGVGTQQLVIIK